MSRSAGFPELKPIGPEISRQALIVGTAVVVAVSLLLRGYNLLALPIFTDEATYLRWAADILDQRTRMSLFIPVAEDGKQPLFIWLATGSMAILPDPLLAGRMVSVVAGVLSTLGMVVAGGHLGGRLVALLAGLLYALVPYALVFDRMALADSWVGTAAIWTFALSVMIVNQGQSSRPALMGAAALGLVMAFGIWIKSTAVFILPFPFLATMVLLGNSRSWLRFARVGLVAYGIFAAIASLLVVMPYAENQLRLFATHARAPESMSVSMPWDRWSAGASAYVAWVQAYLPSPLCWTVMAAVPVAVLFYRRAAVLLLGCWLIVVLPATVLARTYDSRYLVHSVFPLLLLAAFGARAVGLWLAGALVKRSGAGRRPGAALAVSVGLVAVVSGPSLAFDLQLVRDPSAAPWPASDRSAYVEGWPSGYGFMEALDLALASAAKYEGDVFVLSDHFQGLSHDGLALYIRGNPKVQHFVDGRIAWGEPGITEAWRSHKVPLIIFRNDGRFKPEAFEERVPEARQLGIFWKPGGRNSYRVYELDPRDNPAGH